MRERERERERAARGDHSEKTREKEKLIRGIKRTCVWLVEQE